MTEDRKPVLWVSLTSAGRSEMTDDGMQAVQEDLESQLGDDYNIVVADDRVRLATLEDLQEMRETLDALLPSDLETRDERRERQREEMGLSADDVMDGNEDAPGVQEPADAPSAADETTPRSVEPDVEPEDDGE